MFLAQGDGISAWLSVYKLIAQGGFAPIMFLIFVGGYFGVWVWGKELKKADARGDYWQAMYVERADRIEQELREVLAKVRDQRR